MKKPKNDSKLSAVQIGVNYLLGKTEITREEFPHVEWTRVDGNVFSLIATAANAWRKLDPEVARRIRSIGSVAMTGSGEGDLREFASALAEDRRDGYDNILGVLVAVCPDGSDEDSDDESDDEDSDESDDESDE